MTESTIETIARILERDAAARAIVIRGLRPGDVGWLVERHGALYAEEYGWDHSFERLVAGIAAAFDPARDAGWVAERGGERAGCVLCVHEDEHTAQLRTLLGSRTPGTPASAAGVWTRSSGTPAHGATPR